jgi:hypothetical protein
MAGRYEAALPASTGFLLTTPVHLVIVFRIAGYHHAAA